MSALARNFDLVSRVVAVLAAILLAVTDAAIAGRMGTLVRIRHR